MQQIIAVLVLIVVLVQPCLAPAKQAKQERDTGSEKEAAFQGCMKDENDARVDA